ncbi:MAG: NifU family protein [Deltaproteobacteria bacterium]|jgi:Fe-S cluster biogenesis protein NfuA|nr:NifU family protein [Deltaproteobacteria bacterium]
MREKVEKVLEQVRPGLVADGGNIELIDVLSDGKVKVRLTGACHGCPMSQMTLKFGVERALKEAIPEVSEVVLVPDPDKSSSPLFA